MSLSRVVSPLSPSSDRASARSGQTQHTTATRTSRLGKGDTIRTVNTAPPWAKHEPVTPEASTSNLSHFIIPSPSAPRPSNLSARPPLPQIQSGIESPSTPTSASHWWDFALARRKSSVDASGSNTLPKPERRLSLGILRNSRAQRIFEKSAAGNEEGVPTPPRLEIPPPERVFTVNQVRTPGWDTPWQAHVPSNSSHDNTEDDPSPYRRTLDKRNIRRFILHSNLTPLLIRLFNFSFTIATLVVAINIRQLEQRHNVLGAIGSSPTFAIIFSPLTIIHVLVAIYLEYFGRPLGLWRTSAKLAHTLSETLFICAWSAALALAFDNFFNTPLQCSSPNNRKWYSQLPPPPSPLRDQRGDGGPLDKLCQEQIVLISVVFTSLILYGLNLVVSLFRIFEKVRYHTGASKVRMPHLGRIR